MVVDNVWVSPDNQILKEVLKKGSAGLKPTEASECRISIENCSVKDFDVNEYNRRLFIIGESITDFERALDVVLETMSIGEASKVTFKFENEISFVLRLVSYVSHGFIYEWDAQNKCERAVRHKEAGNELYRVNKYIDASYRFGKGLKILCSIPIEVDNPPEEKDGVKVFEIENLKAILYNNLASCYLKHQDYETVITLCEKIFNINENNVKALYKYGVSWYETHDYEKAHKSFLKLLQNDPNNKAALEKLKLNSIKLVETNTKVNAMVKKMFKF